MPPLSEMAHWKEVDAMKRLARATIKGEAHKRKSGEVYYTWEVRKQYMYRNGVETFAWIDHFDWDKAVETALDWVEYGNSEGVR